MENRLEELLNVLTEKGGALANARDHVAQLGDQHSVLKEMAVIRVMERDGISSNAAKDIVRSDLRFMQHCVDQRNASLAVIRAETEYEVAKLRAKNAALTPPDVAELIEANHSLLHARNEAQNRVLELEQHLAEATDAVNTLNAEVYQLGTINSQLVDEAADLDEKLKVSKRETDLREIDLRKARGYLAGRICDVDDLTQLNRELSEKLGIEPRTISFDTLEDSRESLTAEPYRAEAMA